MIRTTTEQNLIAKDAMYHSTCVSSYLSKTNLKVKSLSPTITTQCPNDIAFHSLIQEIDNDLMWNKKTFLLSTLLRHYKALLPQNGDNYKSTRLRSRLEKHYGTSISFLVQHGQGQSTIVLCSSITLGGATKAARRLKQEVKSWQSLDLAGDLTDESGQQDSAEQAILYNAASILKAEMAKVEQSHYYPTPSEVSLQKSAAFVTKMLQTFILWLINAEAYHSISTESHN